MFIVKKRAFRRHDCACVTVINPWVICRILTLSKTSSEYKFGPHRLITTDLLLKDANERNHLSRESKKKIEKKKASRKAWAYVRVTVPFVVYLKQNKRASCRHTMPVYLSWVLILNRLSMLTIRKVYLSICLSVYLSPWSWVLKTLPIVQLLRNFPTLNLEPKGSLPCSEEPATDLTRHWSYPEPDQSSPVQCSAYHHILFFLRFILLLSSHLHVSHSSGLFLLAFPPKSYMYPPDACHIPCPSHPAWLDILITSIFDEVHKLRSSSLCNFLQPSQFHFSSVQIFSSAPSSQIPTVFVLPAIPEVNFYVQSKLCVV
jgi:hypothetical protein